MFSDAGCPLVSESNGERIYMTDTVGAPLDSRAFPNLKEYPS